MLLFFLWACGDVKPTDSDTGEASDSPIDTEVEEEEERFEPSAFTLYAAFGLEDGVLRPFFIDGTEVRPYIQLAFYSEDQERCTVAAFMESGVIATSDWEFEDVTDADNPVTISQQGFFLPSMDDLDIVVGTDCANWDSNLYGELEDKLDHAWGIGFGGSLRADVAAAIQQDGSESMSSFYENDYLIAGSWSSDLWEPAAWASHAFTVSPHEDWILTLDEAGSPTAFYSATEIAAGIDSGIYILNPIFLYSYGAYF